MSPGGSGRLRPSDERAQLAAMNRTTRRIAIGAVVIAFVGVALAAWQLLGQGSASCQAAAWNTTPSAGDLPAGWTISASQYDLDRKLMRFLGPVPADTTTTQPSIDATITCFPDGAADSVTRSRDAIAASGQAVTTRDDLGDQAFSAVDPTGAMLLQVRHGDLVVYIASGSGTQNEVEIIASAFDLAMGGNGGNAPIGTLDVGSSPSNESASPEASDQGLASESPVAPELEAVIPSTVGDVQLAVQSETGDAILSDDQNSRAIIAALRAGGKQPSDLRLAYGYDAIGDSDLVITVFAVDGMKLDALRQLVLDSWLSASGAGITTDSVTLSGVKVTSVDRSDGGPIDYVLTRNGDVITISTADAGLAAQAVAALP